MFILHVWWRNVGYLTYTKVWLTVSLLKHLEYIWHSDLIISSYNTCIQLDYYLYSANEIMFIFLAQVWNNFYIKASRRYKDIYDPCVKSCTHILHRLKFILDSYLDLYKNWNFCKNWGSFLDTIMSFDENAIN